MKKLGIFLLSLLLFAGSLSPSFGANIGPRETLPVPDTTSIVEDSVDATKEIRFEVDGLTTGTIRVLTAIDRDVTLGLVGSGSTVPTTGLTDGEFFLHTPTGRSFYLIYNATTASWESFFSVGTAVIYIDNTDGTDTINQGGAVDGGAFKTFQYAYDAIPANYGGAITINVNGETFAGDVDLRNKKATGAFGITINGTMVSQESGTWSSNGVKGNAGTQGSAVDTGAFAGDSYENLLLFEGGDSQLRLIDSHTDDRLTVVGIFVSRPLNGEAYEVFDWGTIVSGSFQVESQTSLTINNIRFTGDTDFKFKSGVVCNECFFNTGSNRLDVDNASAIFWNTVFNNTNSNAIVVTDFAFAGFFRCKFHGSNTNGIVVNSNAKVEFAVGSMVDGMTTNMKASGRGSIFIVNIGSNGYSRLRNATLGIDASGSGRVEGVTNTIFISVTTETDPVVDVASDYIAVQGSL